MNSNNLFKKLVSGVRFDRKKFAKDFNKFSLNHQNDGNNNIDYIDEEYTEDKQEEEEVNIISDSSKKKPKKEKTRKQLIELNIERVNHLRKVNKIRVFGSDVNDPIESFADLNVDKNIINNIHSSDFVNLTPIQKQTIPLMLDKREVLCCAPTGSGKTLAFLIPIIHHLGSPQRKGFRAVILAPTRELAKQIHRECLWMSQGTGLRVHIIKNVNLAKKKFGTDSKLMYDILVTTPNRLVWLLKQEPIGINIQNVEWLVVDECDKLFESGFRDQLSVIFQSCGQSSKITHAMFSATHDQELQKWAELNLDNLVSVVVGGRNNASQEVDQKLTFVGNESGKIFALRDIIAQGCEAPVLIFVEKIHRAKRLHKQLIYENINIDVIHSERAQHHRDRIVREFREGKIWFLICTELMGRGIDFKGVNLVINYDFPRTAVSYIHRIGRTGRAGRKGIAITFFTEKDADNLRSIANVMRRSGCEVPKFMLELNNRKTRLFRKRKFNQINRNRNKGKKLKNNSNDEEEDSGERDQQYDDESD